MIRGRPDVLWHKRPRPKPSPLVAFQTILQQRVWSLERAAPDRWLVVFTSKSLDKPRVELPLGTASPIITDSKITLSFTSANGGRTIEWTIMQGSGTLDLRVSHGLEVNVERDLDPAVDLMNTDGEIAVDCSIAERPENDRRTDGERAGEWTIAAGAARSVSLVRIDFRPIVRSPGDRLGEGVDPRARVGTGSRAVCVGRRGDAGVCPVRTVTDLRRGVRAGDLALELSAAAALVRVRGAFDGRVVDERSDSRGHRPRQLQRALGRWHPLQAARRARDPRSPTGFSTSRTAISSAPTPA